LGVRRVLGLDASSQSVKEARSRFARSAKRADCAFEQVDILQWAPDAQFEVVSCMFALHYFFESEDTATRFIGAVAASLVEGGHFIGIVPDGLQINECIKRGPFDNGVMTVRAAWEGPPACFGSAYKFGLEDTVVHGGGADGSGVVEYLVYGSVLETLCRQHGLHAVSIKAPRFFKRQRDYGLWHLTPPGGNEEAWKAASRVFGAFAFVKRS
jgi:mRNA (guanine-N7-)-methyltransferase